MEKRPLAIVTGGSSGIGYAIANRLLQEKYEVINADIRPVEKENSEFLHFLQCNVVNAEDVDKLSRLVQETGVPKVLVLNAGRGVHEKIREGDPEKWFDIINTNICGTLRVLRAVLPFMKTGNVVFISSVSATKPYQYGGIYAATKSAIDTIAETLRLEELPEIDVSVISPGVVNTAFFDNMSAGNHSISSIGWGAVEPEEIANSVIFILGQKVGTAVNNLTIRPSRQEF